jgi:putative heme-binding domain-containing protein
VGRWLSPHDLLESILLPSKVITEGYATTEIETSAGEMVAGRVESEDERVIVLRALSASDAPVTVRKADIRRRAFSKVSNMPAGIVNTLSEAQVLDLLAYLLADGDSDHSAFRAEGTAAPSAK